MDKRENALREALAKNAEDTKRWEQYKEENEKAVENLEMFMKHLTVDVMVPVGRKAYMPGQLVHTNEVLVGHYQGYFSQCSAYKAKEICEHRKCIATEHLQKLQVEAELWQNKLDKPYAEGVLPNAEEFEIIEDYDEDQEKRWREKHKLRVKQTKMREKAERESEDEYKVETKTSVPKDDKELSDGDIFKLLEEAELMEELEQELDKLEVDELNDETIRQLMSGELKLPAEKLRVAHAPKAKDNDSGTLLKNGEVVFNGVVKKSELKSNVATIPATNNNFRPNPEMLPPTVDSDESDPDADMNTESELPKEVQIIKEQAQFLPAADQVGFYECQIKIIRRKLLTLPIKSQAQIEEKIHLLNVLEHIEELLEIAEDTCLAEVETEEEDQGKDNKLMVDSDDDNEQRIVAKKSKQQKRRISFALENETLEFRNNETVAEMMPKIDTYTYYGNEKLKHDIITLDTVMSENSGQELITTSVDKKDLIRNKVEQNLEYVTEHQSTKDFDLVNKILESSMNKIHTLHIGFKHSTQPGPEVAEVQENVPGSPADIYEIYLKKLQEQTSKEPTTVYVNAYEGEEQVKVPVLREADRQKAYEDLRMEFSKPISKQGADEMKNNTEINTKKSILRNKTAVEKEKHYLPGNKKSKKKKSAAPPVDEEEYMSAYYKVMNDVVEKQLTEPEPLPQGKFIDAHAPKKRVSRFKQLRSGTEKT